MLAVWDMQAAVFFILIFLGLTLGLKLQLPPSVYDDHWQADDQPTEGLSPFSPYSGDDNQYEVDDHPALVLPNEWQGNYTTGNVNTVNPPLTETLALSFVALDSDGDGFISQQDVFQWMKRRYDLLDDYILSKKPEVFEILFEEADNIPMDGVISLAEFCFFFKLSPNGRRLQPSLPVSPFKPPPQNTDGDDDQDQPGVRLAPQSKPALLPVPTQSPSPPPSSAPNATPLPEIEFVAQSPSLKVAVKAAGVVTGVLAFAALAVITGMSCLSCQSQRMRSYSSLADKSKFSSSLGTTTLHNGEGVSEGMSEGVILIDVIPAFMPAEVPTEETQDNDSSCFISSPRSGCLAKV